MPQKEEVQLPSLVRDYLSRARSCPPASTSLSVGSISLRDIRSFTFSYWLGVGLLLQDRPCEPQVVGFWRQLYNNVVSCSGFLEFVESCKEVRDRLCQGTPLHDLSKGQTRWSRSLIRALQNTYQQPVLHPHPDFNRLMTFLNWLKRLPICIRDENVSIAEYKANEDRLANLDLSNPYVEQLRSVWCEFYGSFRLTTPFRPKHGSGSTADAGRVNSAKWSMTRFDRRASVLLKSPQLESLVSYSPDVATRTAKVVFVPKQAGKDRTICMEPAWIQFLQQGVFDQLRAYLRRCPARDHFDIHNQDINRDLCARAYVEDLATIDLSAASDSVSWNLIQRLAKGTPLYGYLYATRSDQAWLGNEVITLSKFAPMGSALCFPIECMVFACILELAYRIHFGKPSQGRHSACSVYGDDIICPAEIYPLVVDILTAVGFIVNKDKSFQTGPYYESCGVEYLYGALITTVRHPRAHLSYDRWVSPDQIGMITDLANSLKEHGYYRARRLLLKLYEGSSVKLGRTKRPFEDVIDWSETGLVPIMAPYRTLKYDRGVTRSYYDVWQVASDARRTPYDFLQYKNTQERRGDRVRSYHAHTKWSDKAVLTLLRMGHYDLLENGEVECVGPCRTGRLHYRWMRHRIYQ